MLTIGKALSEIRTSRCGVIPYVVIKTLNTDGSFHKSIYFLFAKHKKTGELSDFGGGVKKLETSLEGGFREFCEESRDIFSDQYKSPSDLESCISLVDGKGIDMAEIFVPISQTWFERERAVNLFNNARRCIFEEISDVVWLSEASFDLLVSTGTDGTYVIWKRIQNFLKRSLKSNQKLFHCLAERARLLALN